VLFALLFDRDVFAEDEVLLAEPETRFSTLDGVAVVENPSLFSSLRIRPRLTPPF
jgi:hypothetical protein